MPTGTAGDTAQLYPQNMVHYVDTTITFADDDLVINIGHKLPIGAVVLDVGAQVDTAFSANSVLDIGTSDDPDAYASALVMTTAGLIRDVSTDPKVAHNDRSTTAAVQLVASLTSSGAISAGSAVVWATYMVPGRGKPR